MVADIEAGFSDETGSAAPFKKLLGARFFFYSAGMPVYRLNQSLNKFQNLKEATRS